MFRKLHRQFTLFCTFITGCIFLAFTFICLYLAETSIQKNSYASFLAQLNTALIHLQEQNSISHQWLSQLQNDGKLRIYLYDNGRPLFYQTLHGSEQEKRLKEEAEQAARREPSAERLSQDMEQITVHTEYKFDSETDGSYYASVGKLPKKSGSLSFLMLSSLRGQNAQIWWLRLTVCLADFVAVFLLFLFSRTFTKRLLIPLENSRKQQTHFVAAASHELRAPLAVIRTGLDALRKNDDVSKQAHFIELMDEESVRMQNLISEMLLLANSDSGHLPLQKVFCQPDEMLLNVYEIYEPLAARKGITLSVHLPEELLPDLFVDRERMTQVFSILMENAICYTPESGRVSLSLEKDGQGVRFCFRDSGPGVPDEEKPLIFGRFYRSDKARGDKEHFGLGLCIAREIVVTHGGKIWVEDNLDNPDNPDGGSCFVVRLREK